VKKDVDVTEEDLKNYSLYLLGGPTENVVAKRVFERIPFKVTSDEISVDGISFRAKDAVLHAIYPNPFNKERYVAIAAATSGTGFGFLDLHQANLLQYDFFVTDGKIPVFSAGAKDEKILLASGFFNNDWQVDETLFRRGDDLLRAKCAHVVLNPDLSTSIVSVSQPSLEMLKAYVGTYQVLNGPTVKVTLENNILKAAQMPNEQFRLTLVPTSESEFTIREFNISVGFEKNPLANEYTLAVYQNGQKFASKRVSHVGGNP
jgi:hypothetical protein